MKTGNYRRLRGRIILVQEDRFRAVGSSGRGYLFTLSHRARAAHEDLARWHAADAEVLIEYEGEPNLASGVAHRVVPSSALEI